jgi:hypothetical protein
MTYKGPHKAIVLDGVIMCEHCGRQASFPVGGCDSNLLVVNQTQAGNEFHPLTFTS